MALNFQPNYIGSIMGGGMPSSIAGMGDDMGLAMAPIPAMNVPQIEAPQASGRRSVLDIVGGLGDVFAKVGGADPQYQPQIDARNERARQVDLDAMRRQQFEMQQRQGEQGLKKGELDFQTGEFALDTAQRERMGQASRGLAAVYQRSGAPGLQKAWPMLAQQLGIEPEKAAIFGQALAEDPEGTITSLNAAMNPPTNAGSLPKEMQILAMLQEKDPELANEYMNTIATGMDAYEQGQLGERRATRVDRSSYNNRRQSWAENPNNPRNQPKPGKEGSTPASSADLTRVIRGLETNYNALERGGAIVRQGGRPTENIVARARASGLGQLVEGAVGTNAQTYRDNIQNSRPAIIQAIVKATGMSAKQIDSNAELKLMLTQATDPTQSIQSNREALNRLRAFAESHSGNPPASRGGGNRPAPRARPKLSPKGGPSVSNW